MMLRFLQARGFKQKEQARIEKCQPKVGQGKHWQSKASRAAHRKTRIKMANASRRRNREL